MLPIHQFHFFLFLPLLLNLVLRLLHYSFLPTNQPPENESKPPPPNLTHSHLLLKNMASLSFLSLSQIPNPNPSITPPTNHHHLVPAFSSSYQHLQLPYYHHHLPLIHSECFERRRRRLGRARALQETKEEELKQQTATADEVTKKYGLEAALWKIFTSKEEDQDTENEKSKTDQAKELLTKYGGAYLATSITLSIISFALCYALVSSGVDVQALLDKVGISVDATGEKLGTFALAYAAHKAASPIRFPPTVALTPVVASWIGKKAKAEDEK